MWMDYKLNFREKSELHISFIVLFVHFVSVNVIDFVNVFDYVGVKVRVDGWCSSIILPLDTLKTANVAPWYVDDVITDFAGTPDKAPGETVGDILP